MELIVSSELDGLYLIITKSWVFFFLFILYFFSFLIRFHFAYIVSTYKNYTPFWWDTLYETFKDVFRKAYIDSVVQDLKPLKKEFTRYWLKKHFDKKTQFRHQLYIKFVSYSYILAYILTFFVFVISNLFMWKIDFVYVVFLVLNYLYNHLFHFILCIFIYRLFLSYVFGNTKLRHFYRFSSVIWGGKDAGILDCYNMTGSYKFYKVLAGQRHLVERDLVWYSAGVLGLKKYMHVFFGWEGPKYFVTFKNKYVFRRYYMPYSWASCRVYGIGELVDTPHFRFKRFVYRWCQLILTRSVIDYLLKRPVVDYGCIELTKYYEHNLKNNFKDKY